MESRLDFLSMLEMTCSYPLSTVVYAGKSGFAVGGFAVGLAGAGVWANAVAVKRPSAATMKMLCFFMIKKRFRPEPVKNTPCVGNRECASCLADFK